MAQGGVKHDEEKLRYDLIPVRPMERVAEVYTIGARKYDDRNWEKGLQWGRVIAALERHLAAWKQGERNDQKDGQHHLASVVWCALALMEYEETHPEMDDRPVTATPGVRQTATEIIDGYLEQRAHEQERLRQLRSELNRLMDEFAERVAEVMG